MDHSGTHLENLYQTIMCSSEDDLNNKSAHDQLAAIGILVDACGDDPTKDGMDRAHSLILKLKNHELTPVEQIRLDYCEAGYWMNKRMKNHPKLQWKWDQSEIEQELICLRRALLRAEQIEGFHPYMLCQIYTNTGNILSHIGRFIDAIYYWKRVLEVDPRFGMALGNFGLGAFYYGQEVFEKHKKHIFINFAHNNMSRALQLPLEGAAAHTFQQTMDRIVAIYGEKVIESSIDLYDFSLGETEEEIHYRNWCLQETLFLNSVNDLGNYPISAVDDLGLPGITISISGGPKFHGFYNGVKQEYVSARWFAYEGIHSRKVHFSDKNVTLINTLDYPSYGIGIQHNCIAFRMAYSIFDKIAYFLNSYLNLGIPERCVNFKSLWYNKRDQRCGLRQEFMDRKNLPLRGLFWLSKDLYQQGAYREALDPESAILKEVRDHLEHKYLKVHDSLWAGPNDRTFENSFAYSVYRKEMERMTVKLLRLARSALVYLVLSIHVEELHNGKGEKHVIPLYFGNWEDEWKL